MSLLFITAGTKGGIGKTMTATLLADIALFKKSQQVVLYDCDNENESLKNAYLHPAKGCRVETVKMVCDEVNLDYPLDFVVNDIAQTETESGNKSQNVYIVDMKAGTTHYTLEWLEAFPFDFIREQKIDIYIVGCVTSDIDSVYTLSRWISRFAKDIRERKFRFLIIKNKIQGIRFDSYEEILGSSLRKMPDSNLVVELPEFGRRILKTIKDYRTTIGQVAMGNVDVKNYKLMDQFRIKAQFHDVMKAFEAVWAPPPAMPEESKE